MSLTIKWPSFPTNGTADPITKEKEINVQHEFKSVLII